jgi:hypothetical protein
MASGGQFAVSPDKGLLTGMQATVEGYAFGERVHILGVVDSVMFPGTIAFQRFEYPSALPQAVQHRMSCLTQELMRGLGYRNGMFNVEFMYDPAVDRISVIEINPRMASQFADLFEKVDGTNSYGTLLDLSTGREPMTAWRMGPHRFAASCVLRTFQDMLVAALPSASEIATLAMRYPDIRVEVLAAEGKHLSDEMQDGHSFRYGIINLGGRDRLDVLRMLQVCLKGLTFEFVAVGPDLDLYCKNPGERVNALSEVPESDGRCRAE